MLLHIIASCLMLYALHTTRYGTGVTGVTNTVCLPNFYVATMKSTISNEKPLVFTTTIPSSICVSKKLGNCDTNNFGCVLLSVYNSTYCFTCDGISAGIIIIVRVHNSIGF